MRSLLYYISNPFNSIRISLFRLIVFTTDHLQRMIAHNETGIFTERISATAAALSALEDSTLSDDIQYGIRRGVKLAKDNFRAELPEAIRPIYGAVLSAFNDPSEEMRTVFPDGRTVFFQLRDDMVATTLNSLIDKLSVLESAVGTDTVEQAEALRDQWIAIHGDSTSASAQKAATEENRRQARRQLQGELFITLSYIQTLIPDEPEKLGLYMQTYLLTHGRRKLAQDLDASEEPIGSSNDIRSL